MQATCPEGHTVTIADPDTETVVLRGVLEDGTEVLAPAVHDELLVVCNAMVERTDAEGNPETVQCGITFDAYEGNDQ